MRRRRLAKRLQRIAELREQVSRALRIRAERNVRETRDEMARLEREQAEAEAAMQAASRQGASVPLSMIASSRAATRWRLQREEEELSIREGVLSERSEEHMETIARLRISERVTERVTQRWRTQVEAAERRELDDLAGAHWQVRRRGE